MILVYRRDRNGTKYRSLEPASLHTNSTQVQKSSGSHGQQYTWVKDPETGREYRHAVPAKPSKKKQQVRTDVTYQQCKPYHVDHRTSSETPGTGYKHGSRTPLQCAPNLQDRFPGIIPLEEKEGKSTDKKSPTILDWAKNCPVTYAEKLKYEDMNLPIWIWAYISEILSSRTGLSPDLPRGELESRLQHLLCVLQIALIHSEKTDFNSHGWTIAGIYAKRVQQKLDRGLDTWDSFSRFDNDPHPSEMFAATTEADKKVQHKKKDDRFGGRGGDKPKRLCPTWNICDVERKCQYLVDNPSVSKCAFRHECSYCIEKKHGNHQHQRRFCAKRRAAGDS